MHDKLYFCTQQSVQRVVGMEGAMSLESVGMLWIELVHNYESVIIFMQLSEWLVWRTVR